jgi:tol-pal system protein YbgF
MEIRPRHKADKGGGSRRLNAACRKGVAIGSLFACALAFFIALAASGCVLRQDVAREDFESLAGRVARLEDAVYRGGAAGSQGASGAPGSFGTAGHSPAMPAYGPGGPSSVQRAAAIESSRAQPRASGAERTRYNRAHALLKQKKFNQAAQIFSEMLAQNPGGPLAPNARYWLGECRYASGDYQGALAEFRRGLADYPSSNKAPDCLLKISYCQSLLGDGPGAMSSLNQLLASYPSSPSAQLVRGGRTRFGGR